MPDSPFSDLDVTTPVGGDPSPIPEARVAPEQGSQRWMPTEIAGTPGHPVRLALLDPVGGGPAALDGAWWPRSRSLTEELPALIADLHRRGIRVTRVAYNRNTWEVTPRRLPADDRVIRLGWFQGLDPHLLSLSSGAGGQTRLDLLVIPPCTSEPVARRAMAAASALENHSRPTAILDGLGAVPPVDEADPPSETSAPPEAMPRSGQ